MRFTIADLNVHPLLRNWMGRYFGETCSATEMLMLVTIVYVWNRYADDLDMRHMQVVRKIIIIAKTSNRPQRVPTRKQFESLLHDYDLEFYRNPVGRGARLVPTQTAKKVVDAILSHETAASSRIGSPRAA
ncbi:hypothetical protein J5277_28820 [Rhizobium sp. 16-449-1b]|uniref:hypothetical protein n=1 Tax=Rhizobium sp. 16-449-1b TaxID=2819989 RepID=UPI001AD9FED5|nr:hypothetical protein [Rhizobium sp. 16-449-1b]MBO9198136.1 hypothetical protein [Rhizobium sp. 16-449-1b]